MTYYENNASKTSDTTTSPEEKINISGNSGGIAVLLNPTTNLGYYFEIIALTEDNITSYLKLDKDNKAEFSINNILCILITAIQLNIVFL